MTWFTRIVSIILLLNIACVCNAEIYSWTDKDGKKHFGEKVPKEYLSQSSSVNVKPINAMVETKVVPKPSKPNNQINTGFFVPPPQNNDDDDLSSCERQKQAYQRSVMCYSSCQSNNQATGVNNVAGCRHCEDVKKPNC